MTSQYLRDADGDLTGPTLQEAVFAGTVDPGNIVAVREIKAAPAGSDADTALFSGSRTDYTVTTAADGTITVTDTTGTDGTDTVRNVELLKFADQTVDLRVTAPGAPVIGAASAGPGAQEATVTWSAPASSGGSPITFYRVQVFEAPVTAASTPVRTITGIGPDGPAAGRDRPGARLVRLQGAGRERDRLGPVSDASNTVVVQDPTPTVSARTPASGATNVSVPSNVTVTFDRAVTGVTASTLPAAQPDHERPGRRNGDPERQRSGGHREPEPAAAERHGDPGRAGRRGRWDPERLHRHADRGPELDVHDSGSPAGADGPHSRGRCDARQPLEPNVTATFNRPVQGANTTTVRLRNTRTNGRRQRKGHRQHGRQRAGHHPQPERQPGQEHGVPGHADRWRLRDPGPVERAVRRGHLDLQDPPLGGDEHARAPRSPRAGCPCVSPARIAQREAAFFSFLKARTLSKDVGSTTSATDR